MADSSTIDEKLAKIKYMAVRMNYARTVLFYLLEEPRYKRVADICMDLNESQSLVSQKLAKLREADLVEFHKSGRERLYYMTDKQKEQALAMMDGF